MFVNTLNQFSLLFQDKSEILSQSMIIGLSAGFGSLGVLIIFCCICIKCCGCKGQVEPQTGKQRIAWGK